jgi:hypothetical protein
MTIKEIFQNIVFYGLESLGKYYSSYRGYVVDNEDEEGLGRIQIKIPTITQNKVHPTWAYPKTQWGGNDYGMQLLPLKGEMVWVEFEHGDTRFPIWNFAHRAKQEKPEEFSSSKIYGFKSPKGQVIIIDDNEEKIFINHGNNEGLVKVIETTEMFNKNEEKINEILSYLKNHVHIDPISGYTGQPFYNPASIIPPQPLGTQDLNTAVPNDIDITDKEYIENAKVNH